MLIIRLARHGRKKTPFYHLVVAEKARAVQKKYVAKLGYYNPLANEGKGELEYDQEKTEFYIKNGAQLSQTAARLLSKAGCKEAGKFIVARPSKPKKEEPKPEPTEEAEAAPAEESAPATEEAPAEEPKEEAPAEEKAEETVEEKPEEAPKEEEKAEEAPAEEAKEESSDDNEKKSE